MPKSLKDNITKDMPNQDKKYLEKFGDKLSSSSKYAQWISDTNEKPERKGRSLITRNHDVIKKWAEERDARPATVPGTGPGKNLGVLRFKFGDSGSDRLEEVSWEEFFKTFDDRDLAFVYQEQLKNGNQSNFFRFDSPHRDDA